MAAKTRIVYYDVIENRCDICSYCNPCLSVLGKWGVNPSLSSQCICRIGGICRTVILDVKRSAAFKSLNRIGVIYKASSGSYCLSIRIFHDYIVDSTLLKRKCNII